MTRPIRLLAASCVGGIAVLFLVLGTVGWAAGGHKVVTLEQARIFIEYNSTDNDLGFHVFLDGEDWTKLKIVNPKGRRVFDVEGKGPYKLGITELFFEGAEPSLDDFPLDRLLALFPEGHYSFAGKYANGDGLRGTATLTHAIPDGPSDVSAVLGGNNSLVISWKPVTGSPEDFPQRPIRIVGYQVLVDELFDVKLPASSTSVTVPPELVAALESGEHKFEVLAIEEGGNQSITEDTFMIP